jgi:cytochrome c oxidase subunit II
MRFLVVAQTPADFQAWEKRALQPEARPQGPQSLEGWKVFQGMTCMNCHALRGTQAQARVAPDLTHLDDRQTLAAGLLANTSQNLADWLKNPQSVKPGCLMPNLQLTDAQTAELTDYLEEKP